MYTLLDTASLVIVVVATADVGWAFRASNFRMTSGAGAGVVSHTYTAFLVQGVIVWYKHPY